MWLAFTWRHMSVGSRDFVPCLTAPKWLEQRMSAGDVDLGMWSARDACRIGYEVERCCAWVVRHQGSINVSSVRQSV